MIILDRGERKECYLKNENETNMNIKKKETIYKRILNCQKRKKLFKVFKFFKTKNENSCLAILERYSSSTVYKIVSYTDYSVISLNKIRFYTDCLDLWQRWIINNLERQILCLLSKYHNCIRIDYTIIIIFFVFKLLSLSEYVYTTKPASW